MTSHIKTNWIICVAVIAKNKNIAIHQPNMNPMRQATRSLSSTLYLEKDIIISKSIL